MTNASELPFRMLCRGYGVQLCFTPMMYANHFVDSKRYRLDNFFTCPQDRPLIVQFAATDAAVLVGAAKLVAADCDGIDINACWPQTKAKKGSYGAFLQGRWADVVAMVKAVVAETSLPVSCKMRLFKTEQESVQAALELEQAGCSFITVHGRTRPQKGKGVADWDAIRAVRKAVKIPVIANGSVREFADVERCMERREVSVT